MSQSPVREIESKAFVRSIKIKVLFSALLLNLPNSKHHVHSTAAYTKSTLTFRDDVTVMNVLLEAVQQNSCQNFACNGEQ